MAKRKKSGKSGEKSSIYYAVRHDANMQRKKERHQKKVEYFKARNTKYSVLVPREVTQFLSPSVTSWYNSNTDKKRDVEIIASLANKLIEESSLSLPKGRIKKELRIQLHNK